MSEIVRLKTRTQIENEAAVWTWRLDSGGLGAGERAQLEAWLREDPRHRRAFEELRSTWTALDRLADGEREQNERIAALAGEAAPRSALEPAAPAPRRRQPYWRAAAAAVLVTALGAALWVARRPGMQVMSTAVGQQRHVRLADGSQVTLNTNTLLVVRLTAQRRDLYLRRGEAHFDVVHQAARPFFVHAGDALIRDVGTQFEVRMHSDRDVDVLVNEGRVEVHGPATAAQAQSADARAGGEDAGWVRALSAGEQLSIAGPDLKVMAVSPHQVADELAWRDGALVFEGEPLSEAVAEVARYTSERIVLTGPKVGTLRVSGRFRIGDVPGFFQALQAALPVRVNRANPQLVYIAPR
ncbi:MAG TPA: FecR domain-containing protein [Steroidobacteraceae bacterium]|nr:FecR domain-containing protein [Steroidobacteraceae bacterium]